MLVAVERLTDEVARMVANGMLARRVYCSICDCFTANSSLLLSEVAVVS